MPTCIVNGKVLNPTNPGENFTEKWERRPELLAGFLRLARTALAQISTAWARASANTSKRELFEKRFGVDVEEARFGVPAAAPAVAVAHTRDRPRTLGCER